MMIYIHKRENIKNTFVRKNIKTNKSISLAWKSYATSSECLNEKKCTDFTPSFHCIGSIFIVRTISYD